MLRKFSRTIRRASLIFLWMTGSILYGQQSEVNIQDIRETSLNQFEQGDYRSSLSGFRTLMASESKDPLYRYYAGRCLVELNQDLDQAIELLYMASKMDTPPDVVYHLGMAYFRFYDFREAQKYFERYERIATRQEKKESNIKLLIATCRSARDITSSYNPFKVMNVTFINLYDSLQFSQVKMKGGQLGRKPAAWHSADEDPEALTGLMFTPARTIRGDYLYYSGYGRGSKEGAQIFRVRKGSGKNWSDPEEVSSLNSSGNEILPYFDPIENDLYFASDGRYGVGGFDLYKSHYDRDRDEWTEPTNLGFPVNSVMDEYLLLPGSDLGMVLFFSSRQVSDSMVTVYRVHLVEPKKQLEDNNRLVRDIAQLGGVAEDILAEMHKIERDEPMEVETEIKPAEQEVTVSPYQQTVAIALRHQAVSDSLKDLAAGSRIKVRASEDPNDRWVWQKQIMVWEKRARDEEAQADKLYAQIESDRTIKPKEPAVNPPETLVVERQIDGLTVYRYAEPGAEVEGEPGSQPPEKERVAVSAQIKRFDILAHSPYSTVNPIPMDVTLPSGTYYRIQLGAFGAPVQPGTFGGLSPITGEHLKDRGLIKYYAGKFTKYKDASQALPRIQSKGYEDAFIVAWYNRTQVSTQKAKQLE